MIRGPSGGGKTTLLNLIGTLDAPSTGTIEVMGQAVDKDTPDEALAELRLKHIGSCCCSWIVAFSARRSSDLIAFAYRCTLFVQASCSRPST